jgi:hypothetical protein
MDGKVGKVSVEANCKRGRNPDSKVAMYLQPRDPQMRNAWQKSESQMSAAFCAA